MKIRCIAVDDEPLALRVIESHAEKLNNVELIARCSNAMEAFEILKKKEVDLIFLDIQMPELTGIEFLKSLAHPPRVIFTTAYRNYAIEAFDLDVLDYLLKPISFERFLKAINKFFVRQEEMNTKGSITENHPPTESPHIFIRKNKTMIRLELDKVLYVESLKDYVKVHMESESYLLKYKISQLEEELPADRFLRIHKSFIISLNRISTISPHTIGIDDVKLPIGRSYKELVLRRLSYYQK